MKHLKSLPVEENRKFPTFKSVFLQVLYNFIYILTINYNIVNLCL